MTTNIAPTLAPEMVFDLVHRKGTKFATVRFIKKDGSERVINGHFRAVKHIVGSERGAMQSEVLKAKGLVPIYSMKDGGWRSFSADRVLEVR
jgi:hypothetical protein